MDLLSVDRWQETKCMFSTFHKTITVCQYPRPQVAIGLPSCYHKRYIHFIFTVSLPSLNAIYLSSDSLLNKGQYIKCGQASLDFESQQTPVKTTCILKVNHGNTAFTSLIYSKNARVSTGFSHHSFHVNIVCSSHIITVSLFKACIINGLSRS